MKLAQLSKSLNYPPLRKAWGGQQVQQPKQHRSFKQIRHWKTIHTQCLLKDWNRCKGPFFDLLLMSGGTRNYSNTSFPIMARRMKSLTVIIGSYSVCPDKDIFEAEIVRHLVMEISDIVYQDSILLLMNIGRPWFNYFPRFDVNPSGGGCRNNTQRMPEQHVPEYRISSSNEIRRIHEKLCTEIGEVTRPVPSLIH